ncbi:MAG: hypothetical protein GEU93_07865 [Propionibacteriales bacterium]|nr:hypothetical protein [Propionibacteriales bacterium]
MNRGTHPAVRALAGIGDAWDGMVHAVRRTPIRVREAVAGRLPRRIGVVAGAVMLLLYLVSIGDVAVSLSGRWADAGAVQLAVDGLFRSRAPYLFEPVAAVYLGAHLAVFFSPVNLLLGLVIAVLVAANIAMAVHASHTACARPGYTRVLGVLPAFLLGFACCAPTFVLALGAGGAAAVLPVLLPLRPVFYPLALLLLLGALVWSTHRLESLAPADQPAPADWPAADGGPRHRSN